MPKSFSFYVLRRRAAQGLVLSLSAFVLGCGGGGNTDTSSSTTSPLITASGGVAASVTTINGINVPIDPGTAGKASLAGVDSNANGVRDEVERELAALYGKTPALHAAAISFARKLQSGLGSPSTSSAEASASIQSRLSSFECLASAVGNRDDALAAAQVIAARSYNTQARLAEQTREYELSGLVELPDARVSSCS